MAAILKRPNDYSQGQCVCHGESGQCVCCFRKDDSINRLNKANKHKMLFKDIMAAVLNVVVSGDCDKKDCCSSHFWGMQVWSHSQTKKNNSQAFKKSHLNLPSNHPGILMINVCQIIQVGFFLQPLQWIWPSMTFTMLCVQFWFSISWWITMLLIATHWKTLVNIWWSQPETETSKWLNMHQTRSNQMMT